MSKLCTKMAKSASVAFLILLATSVFSITKDLDYLPKDQNYDPSIPLPEEVLGYPVGTWHVRPDQLIRYMEVLAEKSDRFSLEVTGYSHEQRPLVLITITAPENHKNVEQIKTKHINNIQSGDSADNSDPLIIYMGYSVHGNEPSGSNAALLLAYHLAASNSPQINKLLNENVVLLDPVLNPDGLARFAHWANMHKGKNRVTDPTHREHREHWPSGRTNHYWFDLNRDWLLLTHPESKARIAKFHEWRPHILTDFHEMGTNSTYFFQPGVPSRKNPLTPSQNVTLTSALGEFHAKALDADKQLYFTEESFDDFYYGKGSTYPDAHGSIGILFEQASSRGHAQESINGVVTFERTIQNQFTTSLSTFTGALANKPAILAYQKQFYKDTQKLIDDDDNGGFIIGKGRDNNRFERMIEILKSHKIDVKNVDKDIEVNDITFTANNAVFVSLDQTQYRLISSMFSERQRFADNTFYDVSNWNIALAFNLDYAPVKSSLTRRLALSEVEQNIVVASDIVEGEYAYAFEWFDHKAPAFVQSLLEKEVQVRVAGGDFTAQTSKGSVDFHKGTVLIPAALRQPKNLTKMLSEYASKYNIVVHTITSGLTSRGMDLGSRRFAKLEKPEVLIIGGMWTTISEAGETWHYLDTHLGLPATIWDLRDLENRDISRYTHIMFGSGRYNGQNEKVVDKIEDWVNKGGVLIGQKTALTWFSKNGWIENKPVSREALDAAFPTKGLQFEDRQALAAKKLVAGAVYKSTIDLSHPLFFGFENNILPVFKTGNMVLEPSDNPFEDIAMYLESPLVAGYSADEMQSLISNTSAIVINKKQRGTVIGFVDNVHFRGYWDGTNKLTANALYMAPLF